MNAKAFRVLQEEKRKLEEKSATLEKENVGLREKLELLQAQVDDLLRRVYGRRSERFVDPNQRDLFEEILNLPEVLRGSLEEKPQEREKIEYERKRPQKRGPKPIPEHLPRDVERLDPEESERTCACCNKPMKCVDEIVTEELTVKPPEFRVTQYVRGKWSCKDCMTGHVVKPLPPRPIERGRPSPTLLAYIIVSKWADHLPLYRQEEIFKRYGLELSRKTMDSWLGLLADLLRPIAESMKRWLLLRSFLQSDDTPIRYLDRRVKGKSQRGYLWAWGIPGGEVVYQFTTSRSHKRPLEFLGDFTGDLQTDGLEAYKGVCKTGRVKRVACMAHIRRKFFEASQAAPERVEGILDLIRTLYKIEEKAREEKISGEALVALRRQTSPSILEKLRASIDELEPLTTPGSKLGKAVSYAQRQWEPMLRYVDVAEAQIDNNWCENALRPVVLCRKSFLFLGSEKGGGNRAEVFFTLVQSARRLGVDPFGYLSDVIERVSTHPASRVWELTPRGWKEERAKAEKALASPSR